MLSYPKDRRSTESTARSLNSNPNRENASGRQAKRVFSVAGGKTCSLNAL